MRSKWVLQTLTLQSLSDLAGAAPNGLSLITSKKHTKVYSLDVIYLEPSLQQVDAECVINSRLFSNRVN